MRPREQRVYVLRVWVEHGPSGAVVWRASITHPAGRGRPRFFSAPAEMLAYLASLLEPWLTRPP